ncbi:MAG: hypothetical protein GY871_04635 [Actinomycetales bacterium]|nr:hypothetical protein [Actinomycetales bacterium]
MSGNSTAAESFLATLRKDEHRGLIPTLRRERNQLTLLLETINKQLPRLERERNEFRLKYEGSRDALEEILRRKGEAAEALDSVLSLLEQYQAVSPAPKKKAPAPKKPVVVAAEPEPVEDPAIVNPIALSEAQTLKEANWLRQAWNGWPRKTRGGGYFRVWQVIDAFVGEYGADAVANLLGASPDDVQRPSSTRVPMTLGDLRGMSKFVKVTERRIEILDAKTLVEWADLGVHAIALAVVWEVNKTTPHGVIARARKQLAAVVGTESASEQLPTVTRPPSAKPKAKAPAKEPVDYTAIVLGVFEERAGSNTSVADLRTRVRRNPEWDLTGAKEKRQLERSIKELDESGKLVEQRTGSKYDKRGRTWKTRDSIHRARR